MVRVLEGDVARQSLSCRNAPEYTKDSGTVMRTLMSANSRSSEVTTLLWIPGYLKYPDPFAKGTRRLCLAGHLPVSPDRGCASPQRETSRRRCDASSGANTYRLQRVCKRFAILALRL